MLQKLDSFMQQSPDVQGVTIDFGNAPAHGQWRAMSMTIGLVSKCGKRRTLGWFRKWTKGTDCGSGYYSSKQLPPQPYERVEHIQLKSWELLE